jgi:hypothetical protein
MLLVNKRQNAKKFQVLLVNNRRNAKKVPDTFFQIRRYGKVRKAIPRYSPFHECINVFVLFRQREELLQGNMGRGLLMIAHSLLR